MVKYRIIAILVVLAAYFSGSPVYAAGTNLNEPGKTEDKIVLPDVKIRLEDESQEKHISHKGLLWLILGWHRSGFVQERLERLQEKDKKFWRRAVGKCGAVMPGPAISAKVLRQTPNPYERPRTGSEVLRRSAGGNIQGRGDRAPTLIQRWATPAIRRRISGR